MEYKTTDGWDLEEIGPLGDAVSMYENMCNSIYELKNCCRTISLVEMRDALLDNARAMVEALEEIEDDDTVVEDEEEDN